MFKDNIHGKEDQILWFHLGLSIKLLLGHKAEKKQ